MEAAARNKHSNHHDHLLSIGSHDVNKSRESKEAIAVSPVGKRQNENLISLHPFYARDSWWLLSTSQKLGGRWEVWTRSHLKSSHKVIGLPSTRFLPTTPLYIIINFTLYIIATWDKYPELHPRCRLRCH